MEHPAPRDDAAIRVAFLTACGRAELCQALLHHPASPYPDREDHPVADHIESVRRGVVEARAIIAGLRDHALPSGQQGQLGAYVEACDRYLSEGLIPACDALLAGDYQAANKHLHHKDPSVFAGPDKDAESPGQAGEAEQTLLNLSVILGISIAASTLWIGAHAL